MIPNSSYSKVQGMFERTHISSRHFLRKAYHTFIATYLEAPLQKISYAVL